MRHQSRLSPGPHRVVCANLFPLFETHSDHLEGARAHSKRQVCSVWPLQAGLPSELGGIRTANLFASEDKRTRHLPPRSAESFVALSVV